MTTATIKSNLLHSVELKNWVVFRQFLAHLKGMLDASQQEGKVLIVEVWQFEETRPPEKR